jgi:hypothetical protein
MERIELRRRNVIPPDAYPYRVPASPVVAEYDSGDYVAGLDQALLSQIGTVSRRVVPTPPRGANCVGSVAPC